MKKFEIALTDETKEVVKSLLIENEHLKKELAYFQAYLLSGDGKICACCERVRHIDDMVEAQDKHGDYIDLWCCSRECAEKAGQEHDAGVKSDEFEQFLWRSR